MKYGPTCAYTICKNEIKHLETWLYYSRQNFDYRVILDTGSTDGTWEFLQEESKNDPGLIVEQKTFEPWDFSVARNYNLDMIPKDTVLGIQSDCDEWVNLGCLKEIERIWEQRPDFTCLGFPRLDIYSENLWVGPTVDNPSAIGTNKIHKMFDENGNYLYKWDKKIYEHLSFQPKDRNEVEIYTDRIFLIHNQDFKKPERSPLYTKMLIEAHQEDPTDSWYAWFLCNNYFRERDLDNFIKVGGNFVRYHKDFDPKYHEVLGALTHMYHSPELTQDQKNSIEEVIKGKSI